MVDDAFEAVDAEVSPAGGKVGIGNLADGLERHDTIIRFSGHTILMPDDAGLMQVTIADRRALIERRHTPGAKARVCGGCYCQG